MTRDDFLKKYPRPWAFERTDRDGSGCLLDANGQIMAVLGCDQDWPESLDDPLKENFTDEDQKSRPVFNGGVDEFGEICDDEERALLLDFLLDSINGR